MIAADLVDVENVSASLSGVLMGVFDFLGGESTVGLIV